MTYNVIKNKIKKKYKKSKKKQKILEEESMPYELRSFKHIYQKNKMMIIGVSVFKNKIDNYK